MGQRRVEATRGRGYYLVTTTTLLCSRGKEKDVPTDQGMHPHAIGTRHLRKMCKKLTCLHSRLGAAVADRTLDTHFAALSRSASPLQMRPSSTQRCMGRLRASLDAFRVRRPRGPGTQRGWQRAHHSSPRWNRPGAHLLCKSPRR
jgi:hypothetical protein